jgi:hypothetical protein
MIMITDQMPQMMKRLAYKLNEKERKEVEAFNKLSIWDKRKHAMWQKMTITMKVMTIIGKRGL